MPAMISQLFVWLLVGLHFETLRAKSHGHHNIRHHHNDHLHHRGSHHYHRVDGDWNNYPISSSVVSYDEELSVAYELPSEWNKDPDYISGSSRSSNDRHIPSGQRESFYDEIGRTVMRENFAVETKKKIDDNSSQKKIITAHSRMFSNVSEAAGKTSYSTGHVFYNDGRRLSTTTMRAMVPISADGHLQPIPMASQSRSNLNANNFIGRSRWTLKYKGMPSEGDMNNTRINITAKLGGGAFLPCKVGHLGGDRQISWIRRRDWHVLTSGKTIYTQDKRFSVLHEPGSQDWTLHIKLINMKDSGNYECQVSTGTGIISLFVKMDVVIPEAYIPGYGQYHVDRGSSISLSCFIKNSPAPPQYILWHHNGQLLNFLRDRPDIRIEDDLHKIRTNYGFQFALDNGVDSGFTEEMHANADLTMSRLQVDVAEDNHSGNYSCSAPNTQAASTLVFITEGDKTAAVQRIDSGAASTTSRKHIITSTLYVLMLFYFS